MDNKTFEFQSVAEAWQYSRTSPCRLDDDERTSICESKRKFHDYTSVATWTSIMEKGWPDGAEKVAALAQSISGFVIAKLQMPVVVRDVVGDCYDIGLVVTGEPECALLWDMQDATENSGGKVLKLVYNCVVHGGEPAAVMLRRAAAILAMGDVLEAIGYRCEIIADAGLASERGGAWCHVITWLKKADQPFDLNALAATAHACYLRRLIFGVMETLPDAKARGYYMDAGYGWGAPAIATGDVLMESTYCGGPRFSTDNDAATWVFQELQKLGVHVEDRE